MLERRGPAHQAFGQGRWGWALPAWSPPGAEAVRRPIRGIQRSLADPHGPRVSVGVGDVVEVLHRVAAPGAEAGRAIRDAARGRAVVHADETGGRAAGPNGYAWLLAPPAGACSVEFPEFPRSCAGTGAGGVRWSSDARSHDQGWHAQPARRDHAHAALLPRRSLAAPWSAQGRHSLHEFRRLLQSSFPHV